MDGVNGLSDESYNHIMTDTVRICLLWEMDVWKQLWEHPNNAAISSDSLCVLQCTVVAFLKWCQSVSNRSCLKTDSNVFHMGERYSQLLSWTTRDHWLYMVMSLWSLHPLRIVFWAWIHSVILTRWKWRMCVAVTCRCDCSWGCQSIFWGHSEHSCMLCWASLQLVGEIVRLGDRLGQRDMGWI